MYPLTRVSRRSIENDNLHQQSKKAPGRQNKLTISSKAPPNVPSSPTQKSD